MTLNKIIQTNRENTMSQIVRRAFKAPEDNCTVGCCVGVEIFSRFNLQRFVLTFIKIDHAAPLHSKPMWTGKCG